MEVETGTLAIISNREQFSRTTLRKVLDNYSLQTQIYELTKLRGFGLAGGYLESMGYTFKLECENRQLLIIAKDDSEKSVMAIDLTLPIANILIKMQECVVELGKRYRNILYEKCYLVSQAVHLTEVIQKDLLPVSITSRLWCGQDDFWSILHRLDLVLELWGVQCEYCVCGDSLRLSYACVEVPYTLHVSCEAVGLYRIYAFLEAMNLVKFCWLDQQSQPQCMADTLSELCNKICQTCIKAVNAEESPYTILVKEEDKGEISVSMSCGSVRKSVFYSFSEPEHVFLTFGHLVTWLSLNDLIDKERFRPKLYS